MARMNFGGRGTIKPTPAEIAADIAERIRRRQQNRARGAAGRQQLIAEMARFMVDRRVANDNCTVEDLKREGFTEAEIAEFADRARERARRLARERHGREDLWLAFISNASQKMTQAMMRRGRRRP